jgi:serine/threonine protein kinase
MMNAPLSTREILDVVQAVGDALQYAHQKGVLHRDIKPANVMLSRDGHIFLTDFGLARIMEGTTSLTGERILGTPYYISPEQALNATNIDDGTDIYSFGVMIYEMVVGCLPYDGKTAFSIIEDHINTPPPFPTSIKPDLAKDVEAVLLKALAKKRKDRYGTVMDLVQSFKKAWVANTELKTISSVKTRLSKMALLLSENGTHFPLRPGKVLIGRDSSAKKIHNDIDLSSLDDKK